MVSTRSQTHTTSQTSQTWAKKKSKPGSTHFPSLSSWSNKYDVIQYSDKSWQCNCPHFQWRIKDPILKAHTFGGKIWWAYAGRQETSQYSACRHIKDVMKNNNLIV